MANLSPSPTADFAQLAGLLQSGVASWQDSLSAVADADLPAAWHLARTMERSGWRLRCAIAGEIHARAKRDAERGARIMDALAALADSIEISERTIRDDALIARTFPGVIRATDTPDVGRHGLLLATRAPDPQAALELYTARKTADPTYSTRDFAADIRRQNAGVGATESVDWRTWEIQLEAEQMTDFRTAVQVLVARWGGDWHSAIYRAVVGAAEQTEEN